MPLSAIRPHSQLRGRRFEQGFLLMLVPASLALGAAYAGAAYAISPWLVPGLVVAAIAAWIAWSRPDVGVALALLLIPADTFGLSSKLVTYGVVAWAVYLVLVSWRRSRERGLDLHVTLMTRLWLAYFAVSVLSLTQAVVLKEGQGLARNILTGGLLLTATAWSVRDRRSVQTVLAGFGAAALVVGAHAVLDLVSGRGSNSSFVTSAGEYVGRLSSGFAQPNELGGFLVLVVPLALAGGLTARRWRSVWFGGAVLAAVGVYASFSRGALVALAVVPFVFLRGRRGWLAAPLLALILLLAAPSLVTERFATLGTSGADVSTREDIWRVAFDIWQRHPVIGVGLGNFADAYAGIPIAGKEFLPNTVYQPPPHAHDVFLQLMAEQGILGLIAFVAILVLAIRLTLRLRAGPEPWLRHLGSGLLAALAAFLAHNLVDLTLEDPHTGLLIFTLFGLIAGCAQTFVPTAARARDVRDGAG